MGKHSNFSRPEFAFVDIYYTLADKRVIYDPKYCNSLGDAMAIAPHQFQLVNHNRYNPHEPVG
ncbi:hypothetical protein [Nostoc sp.]|uniref:hypothetical protein n=1 Tax=Nostoc sp. TaxID=1180 RepID=UPI002FF7ABCD